MKDTQKSKEELIGELIKLRQQTGSRKKAEETISDSERFLSNVFSSIQDGISILDKDYTILSVNPTMEKWYSYAMPLVGKKCYKAYHSRDKACEVCPTRETLETGKANVKVVPKRGSGGKIVGWFDLYSFPLRDSQTNEIQGVIEYVRDITDRKKVEEELRESEKRFQQLAENAQEWIWEVDKNGLYMYASPVVEKILGYKPEEIVRKKHFYDLFSSEDKEELKKAALETFAKKKPFRDFINRNVRRDGKIVWLLTAGVPMLNEEGNLIGYRGVDTDITNRKRAEEEILKEKNFSETAINSLPGVFYLINEKMKFVRWNRNLEEISGYSAKEISKMNLLDFFIKEEKTVIADKIREIFTKGKAEVETSILTKQKKVMPYYLTGMRLEIGEERYFVGMGIDIAERKKAEEALRFTQFSVDKAADAVFWIGPDARIYYVNDAACRTLRYSREELLSMHVYDFDPNFPKKNWKRHWRDLQTKGSTTFESLHRAKDGMVFPVDITANHVSFAGKEYNCAFARNIYERKKTEEDLKDSEQKFRAIFDNSTDGLVLVDPEAKNIFTFNKTICDMLGYNQEEFKSIAPEDFHAKEDWPYIRKKFEKLMTREITEVDDIPVKKRDGTIFYSSIRSYLIILEGKEYVVCIFRDITERKKAEQKLEILNKYLVKTNEKLQLLAMRDYHTGLYNYHYLVDIIEAELNRAKRYAAALSIIMIDVDYFKSINEVYGSKTGDMVLKQLARELRKDVRRYDIVTRFGGEEFVILCPSTDRKAGLALARRVLDAVGTHNFGTKEQAIKLKLSIGVATFPDTRVVKGMDLVDAAEKAMDEAKYGGGNKVYDFTQLKDQKTTGDSKTRANVSGLKRRLDRLTKETNQNLVEAIFAFAKTIELKDHYTGEHVEKTVHYAIELAKRLDMSEQEVERIRQAAILHDLGKIGISDKILLKKSKLSKKEFEVIKKHPQIAADILRPIQVLHNIIPYIFYHHERWNGSGYPSGLKGEEIPVGARVIALADVYQALSSDRPYRKAYSKNNIRKIIKEGAGSQFDPKTVRIFLDILKKEKK